MHKFKLKNKEKIKYFKFEYGRDNVTTDIHICNNSHKIGKVVNALGRLSTPDSAYLNIHMYVCM